jgi:predicted DNA-binding transcriptional regulator YafY
MPVGKADARYMVKILRLISVMDDLPSVDCDIWYMENIPQAAKRTMQRDFASLSAIGYEVRYERCGCNGHDAGFDVPPRHYYCDKPSGAYHLPTFKESEA